MPEWLIGMLSKSIVWKPYRGFESLSLRFLIIFSLFYLRELATFSTKLWITPWLPRKWRVCKVSENARTISRLLSFYRGITYA